MNIVLITDDLQANAALLRDSETLHRQLRPNIPSPYHAYLEKMFSEGAEMAVLLDQHSIRAIAIFRCLHTTFHGLRFYLDDLVTDESSRAKGLGSKMISWCEHKAAERGCDVFDLESGTQRSRAHKFYFRNSFEIFAFSFTKAIRSNG